MTDRATVTWLRPYRRVATQTQSILGKYMEDRGPHLGAMVAYYALLSLFPIVFLSISALGLIGQQTESSYLIKELKQVMPGQSEQQLVDAVAKAQRNAGTFLVIGLVSILWGSLGLYSALESALNIVFRVANRSFVRGKGLGFMLVVGSLGLLFVSLSVATAASGWLHRNAPNPLTSDVLDYLLSLGLSGVGSFVFLAVVYRFLTNVELHRGDVWPGALFGAVLFVVSFQAVPAYLAIASGIATAQVFGGFLVLLIWLYLMSNIIVLGAEINWRHWSQHQPQEPEVDGLA